jgi:asparagine synthase (glutamine-hydrolysing)
MCGICGIVGKSDHALLGRMLDRLIHRGPDAQGEFIEDTVNLGIRRLRIIDLKTGDQPIHNEDKSIWIVYNGEIYNFKILKEQLERSGHRFYTQTDTEVIVHLYEEFGDDCVKHLRGMFVFALWDKNQKRLFMARDRIGIKPLYYTFKNNTLVFASELKSLLENRDFSYTVDYEALDNYLTFLYIPAPLTILKDVFKLPPAHTLSLRGSNLEIRRYWQLEFEHSENRSEADYIERIRDILKEVVKIHMVSDVPLGVLVSGGLDSSTVVGLISRLVKYPIETFSIGFEERFASYNELEYSRLVSQIFNTRHHEIVLKPDIAKIIPKVVWHLDEPFADSSAILNYLITKEAKRFVTVGLTGIGADEIFGGYPRYLGAMFARYYEKLPFFLRAGLKDFSGSISQSGKSRDVLGWVKRFLKSGTSYKDKRYLQWISYLDKQMKLSLYAGEFREYYNRDKKPYIQLDYFNDLNLIDDLDRVSNLDIHTYLADDLLIMADKMSMANSLELRVPFCDHILVEECARIPFSMKLKSFKLKYLFKKAIKDLLPSQILHKKKQGFMVPLSDWLRLDLKALVLETLNKKSIEKRGYFNFTYINRLLDSHFEGKGIHTHRIWALLVFELWARQYLD